MAVLTLVSLNLAGARAGGLSVGERVLVSTPDHRTSEFAAATDPANPAHVMVAGIDWDTHRGTWSCAAFSSTDGGRSWTSSLVFPEDDFALQGDPWVAFGPDGTAHFSCLALRIDSPDGASLLYARSTDGGATWSPAVPIAPRDPKHHVDRNGIVATTGAVVACVNEYQYPDNDPNPYAAPIFDGLAIARSTNGGAAWEPTQQLFTYYAGCRGAAASAGGTLYVSFAGTPPDGITRTGIVRSTDDGATWSEPTFLPNDPADDLGHVYYGGLVTVSQRTGSVFVARPGAKPRLFRSTDAGSSYESITLPDIPTTCATCDGVNRTLVTSTAGGDIAVQVEIGDLGAVRANALYPVSLTKEEWLLVSRDDGATWLPPVRVAASDASSSYLSPRSFVPSPEGLNGDVNGINRNPTDAQANFWSVAGPLQRWDHMVNGGDYTGMTTSGDDVVVMWVAHDNGIPQVWSSRVSISE